jgi:hypothetical protein
MFAISAQARQEVIGAIRERYRSGSAPEKRRILDSLVTLTGYHRKHAIRVLRSQLRTPAGRPPRPRVYDDAVRDVLVVLWEASGRSCGKRLKRSLPILVPALEAEGRLSIDASVRDRLLAVSAATIDRMLTSARTAPPRAADQPRPRDELRAPPQRFAAHAIDATDPATPRRAADLDRPAQGPEAPAPPAAPGSKRRWRTRADPFDEVWPRVVTWLEAEPGQTAKQLLQRLCDQGLGEFSARQLRTLQRRIKTWRHAHAPGRRRDNPGSTPG